MTAYAIYDAEGRIMQANKVFDPPADYEQTIRDFGQNFIKVEQPNLIPADRFYIANGELTEMPDMVVAVSKLRIKAGGVDTVVLTGCPAGADYAVDHALPGIGVVTPFSGKLPDGELEIGMDVPCLFTVRIEKFPYRPFNVQIESAE